MADTPDPLAAELAATRELITKRDALAAQVAAGVGIAGIELAKVQRELIARTPGLLAAVEAVLVLAGEWRQKGLALGAQIVTENADGARAGFMMCTAQANENCAQATRSAISAALLGQDTGKDGSDA